MTTSSKSNWPILTAISLAIVAAGSAGFYVLEFGVALPGGKPPDASHNGEDGHSDAHEGHAHDDHGHAGHDDAQSLELSSDAWKNIGLKTGVVRPQTYVKTIAVPAIVVERSGRSQVAVTAPMTGVVQRVYPIEGEAIQPGQALYDLRLTHEDLVTAQRDFLAATEELAVVKREIARLESVGEGVIAGRRVLEQKYEQDKIEASVHAQRQGLLLHGLSEAQVDDILTTRRLLPSLTVTAPTFPEEGDHQDIEHLFHVQSNHAIQGQHVKAGDPLGTLADHCLLYVEGQAFEDDAPRLNQIARDELLVDVLPEAEGTAQDRPLQLRVLYVADHIDPDSRALRFYLSLPNELVRDESESGHRFVAWKFRPGQRMEVRIPIGQTWTDQIVLPSEAVVNEGAEAFVFEQNGDHFDRVAVHIIYRDSDTVVVENNGKLIGSTLALSGAYQIHLAIKNRAGGGVDPHAGHNH